jgi:hypothetical protein
VLRRESYNESSAAPVQRHRHESSTHRKPKAAAATRSKRGSQLNNVVAIALARTIIGFVCPLILSRIVFVIGQQPDRTRHRQCPSQGLRICHTPTDAPTPVAEGRCLGAQGDGTRSDRLILNGTGYGRVLTTHHHVMVSGANVSRTRNTS